MQRRDPWLGSLVDLTTKRFAYAESWNDMHLFWRAPAPVCFVYNYTNVYFVSWVLLIKRSARYKARIWMIVCSRVCVCVCVFANNTHMVTSSLLLHSREQTLGRQLTASANFCVKSNQQHSAVLLTKGNTRLLAGGLEGRGEASSCNVRCCGHGGGGVGAEVKLCQGCECVWDKFCGATSFQTPVGAAHLIQRWNRRDNSTLVTFQLPCPNRSTKALTPCAETFIFLYSQTRVRFQRLKRIFSLQLHQGDELSPVNRIQMNSNVQTCVWVCTFDLSSVS